MPQRPTHRHDCHRAANDQTAGPWPRTWAVRIIRKKGAQDTRPNVEAFFQLTPGTKPLPDYFAYRPLG